VALGFQIELEFGKVDPFSRREEEKPSEQGREPTTNQ